MSEPRAFAQYMALLRKAEWVVYSKPPFRGPERVLDYLRRYTHRVAISNNRLTELKDGRVSFIYKDYKHENRQRLMTLSADGFQRIRNYGLLGNRHRTENLARCRVLLGIPYPTMSTMPERSDVSCRYSPSGHQRCRVGQLMRNSDLNTGLARISQSSSLSERCAVAQTAPQD